MSGIVAHPQLTDAQVAKLARPGESWEEARARAERLHRCVVQCWPCPECNPERVYEKGWAETFQPCHCVSLRHTFRMSDAASAAIDWDADRTRDDDDW